MKIVETEILITQLYVDKTNFEDIMIQQKIMYSKNL